MDKAAAYKKAEIFAKFHYENFPVISLFIPKDLRKHVAIIYWFARTADDLADEGAYSTDVRLTKLNEFENRLTKALEGNYESSFEFALFSTISSKNLSNQLFYDLLKAFKQDVIKKRYDTFEDLLNYCKFSANPVGRLILELNNIRSENAFIYSDKICTALQLTNFYQDTEIDIGKGRIYYPLNEMKKNNVSEELFVNKMNNSDFQQLLKYSVLRTEEMFKEGRGILNYLKGRLKFEINWTILGGEAILDKIKSSNYRIFNNRPELNRFDFLFLLIKSLF